MMATAESGFWKKIGNSQLNYTLINKLLCYNYFDFTKGVNQNDTEFM